MKISKRQPASTTSDIIGQTVTLTSSIKNKQCQCHQQAPQLGDIGVIIEEHWLFTHLVFIKFSVCERVAWWVHKDDIRIQ